MNSSFLIAKGLSNISSILKLLNFFPIPTNQRTLPENFFITPITFILLNYYVL